MIINKGDRIRRAAWRTRLGGALAALYARVLRDDIFTLAASMAYAAILSVFPLLVLLVAILGRFVEQTHAQQTVARSLAPYLPPSALTVVRRTLTAVAPTAGTAGIAALAGLVWSATALASATRHSLNRVFEARHERPFWRRKLLELAMVLVAGVFLSVSVLATAMEAAPVVRPLARIVRDLLATPLASATTWLSSALSAWAAFLVVYRFLPNARVEGHRLLLGSACAVVLFEACKRGFFWYLRTLARYPAVYGPLVGIVVFVIWIYLVELILLIGAEVTAMSAERAPTGTARGSRHRP